jgi:kinesin family protein 18/19
MKELIRDQDIQITELKKELKVLNSCCSRKNVPITEDTSGVQDDFVSSGPAGRSLVSESNKPDLGSYDAPVDDFHVSKRNFDTQNLLYLSLPLSWLFFWENQDGNTC